MGTKAFWLDPRLQHYLRHFDKERKKRGIKFMHLFDHEVKKEKPEILKLVGKPYRFLPKEYSSPTAVDIFGDYVVTFVGVKPGELYEEPLQFILKSKMLADGYRKFFQFMWDNCKEKYYFLDSFTTFIMFETKNFAFFNESSAGSLFA